MASRKKRKRKRRAGSHPTTPSPPLTGEALETQLRQEIMRLLPRTSAGTEELPLDEEMLAGFLASSADLANERELKRVFFEPPLCVGHFIKASEELGVQPDDLGTMSSAAQRRFYTKVLTEVVRNVFHEEERSQLIEHLDLLRRRLTRRRDQPKRARVALLEYLLRHDEFEHLWCNMGLLREIARKSMAVGLELIEAEESFGSEAAIRSRWLEQVYQDSEVDRTVEEMGQRTPELDDYLDLQMEQNWNQAMELLFQGEVNLGLFTEAELRSAAEIVEEVYGDDWESLSDAEKEAKHNALLERFQAFVRELLTPERHRQFLQRLDEHANVPRDQRGGEYKLATAILPWLIELEDQEQFLPLLTVILRTEYNAWARSASDS